MVDAMKAAIVTRPEYAQAHYMLGIGLQESGKQDEAISELARGDSLRSDDAGAV